MQYSELIAKRIDSLCKKHGITVNRLATMSGLKQSTINNLFRGTSKNPTLKTLQKIAFSFGMTLSEFLDFQELNEYSPEDEDDD